MADIISSFKNLKKKSCFGANDLTFDMTLICSGGCSGHVKLRFLSCVTGKC